MKTSWKRGRGKKEMQHSRVILTWEHNKGVNISKFFTNLMMIGEFVKVVVT